MKLILLEVLLAIHLIDAQFIEQPPGDKKFVPVNNEIMLSCSVEEGFRVDWEVTFSDSNGRPIKAASIIFAATFMERNFNFTGVATTTSTVTFDNLEGNKTNNATTITCLAAQSGTTPFRGNEVQVIFFDAPPPPTDLNVTEDELGSLNIYWSLGFIEGVPVNYTLIVLNLNTTSSQPIIIAGLLDQHYVFETSRPCDVYSFTVTAVTAAGNSTPSQEHIFTRDDDNILCSTSSPEVTTTAFERTTSSSLSAAVVIGSVIGSVASFILVGTLILLLIYCYVSKIYNGKGARYDVGGRVIEDHYDGQPHQELQEVISEEVEPEEQVDSNLSSSIKKRFNENTVPQVEFDRNRPYGLTTSQEGVLVLERHKIKVFSDLKPARSIPFKQANRAEITVHEETGNMFVTTGKAGKVLKLASSGEILDSIFKVEEENFIYTNGLRINSKGELYVCDTKAHKIYVLDLDFNYLRTIVGNEKGGHPFHTPRDVEFDQHDNFYVAESTRIQVLSPNGTFIRMIGENRLEKTVCLKIVEDFIYVTSQTKPGCVSIYSTDGLHITDFGKDPNIIDSPLGIAIDKEGNVYVSTTEEKLLIF